MIVAAVLLALAAVSSHVSSHVDGTTTTTTTTTTGASVSADSDGQLLFVDGDGNMTTLVDMLARLALLEMRAEQQASVIAHQQSTNNQQQSTIAQLQSAATQRQPSIAQLCRTLNLSTFTTAIAQDIATHQASDWEFFTIGGNASYLAVANQYDGSSYNINSQIFVFNSTAQLFQPFQTIATIGATAWKFFTIGNSSYLAVANHYNGSNYNVDSQIFKFNGTAFQPFQTIATHGAVDWEFFTINSNNNNNITSYLAVANKFDGSTFNINSQIFKFDGAAFQPFQLIATQGALDWEFFTIGNASYLAVANYNNGTRNINSQIFVFNGTAFQPFQAIATHGASDWLFFTIGSSSSSFLAVANRYNGSSNNIDSQIFKFNGTAFQPFQAMATHGATDWEFFAIGSNNYLVVANTQEDDTTYNINSQIFQFDGSVFQPFQFVATHGAADWEYFTIGNARYLAVANLQDGGTCNINSQIFSLNPCF